MDRDVSSLMMGMLHGYGKDEFGREKNRRLGLPLDRVLTSRTQGSRLLELPVELLADIADLLADNKTTLAALAFVSTDLRQLARSCQFAEVCFDYSPQAFQLITKLLSEIEDRGNGIHKPSIGPCIRRVVMTSCPGWVAQRHHELYRSIYAEGARESYTQEQRDRLRDEANEQYVHLYRDPLLRAISNGMPHLEAVSWHDQFLVDAEFFKLLTRAPIQHLKLSRTPIEASYVMGPPLTPPSLLLRSLHLDVRLPFRFQGLEGEVEGISLFVGSFLRLCASTLETLYFCGLSSPWNRELISFQPPTLPRLRHLGLQSLRLTSDTLLGLLRAPLRQLSLSFVDWRSPDPGITECEQLRDLETVVMPAASRRTDDPSAFVAFLSNHTHIQKLCVEQSKPDVLDQQIIPLLSGGKFTHLTSLSISWDGPGMGEETRPHIATVAESSLASIGTILSLEQLCLSAGEYLGWRCQWLVDHDSLRTNLRGLQNLRKLALCRDTYPIGTHPEVEGYYEWRFKLEDDDRVARERPALDVPEDSISSRPDGGEADHLPFNAYYEQLSQSEIWELAHRNRMLREADQYATTFPKLDWIFCGQRPMWIMASSDGASPRRKAVPLNEERDTCETLLRQMFSMTLGWEDE